MFEIASLIVLNLVIAVVFGFIVGFIIAKATCPRVKSIGGDNRNSDIKEVKSKPAINPIFKKNSHLDNKPLILGSPILDKKDNLKKIKGIDAKIENDLNNLGIYHFEQIAQWSSKNCDWIEEFLLVPGCAKNNQWVEQAKILYSGKETVYSQKIENGEIEE